MKEAAFRENHESRRSPIFVPGMYIGFVSTIRVSKHRVGSRKSLTSHEKFISNKFVNLYESISYSFVHRPPP